MAKPVKRFERGRTGDEILHLLQLLVSELIEQHKFFEEVDYYRFEVDVQLNCFVLSPLHCFFDIQSH